MRPGKLVIYVVMLLIAGCESKEKAQMLTMNKEVHTVCIGRHKIDLPVGYESSGAIGIFTPVDADDNASNLDVTVLRGDTSRQSFLLAVQNRHSEIHAEAGVRTGILKEFKKIDENVALFHTTVINDAYSSELHMLKAGRYVKIIMNSYNGRFKDAERLLLAFAANLHTDSDSEVGREKFCIGGLAVMGGYKKEYARATFRNADRPDTVISVEIDTYALDGKQGLHERVSGPDSLLKQFDTRHKVLRQAELKVAGMRAQEWLASVDLGKNRNEKQFSFVLETMRPTPAPTLPQIHLELESGQRGLDGKKHPTSLSDQEALALWDSMIPTLRLQAQ